MSAEIGRVDVNWPALAVGAVLFVYVVGVIRFVTWLVPELAEFTR